MGKEIKYYIGIDSGGTKCDIVIGISPSKIIHSVSYKSLHYSIHGTENITDFLSEIILKTIHKNKYHAENCKGICIGIAGARNIEDKEKIKNLLSKKLNIQNILIESDSVIGLYGAYNGGDGIILICGTGSVAFAKRNGKYYQAGGWGKIIGDFGSGYQIGVEALRLIAEEYDRETTDSALQKVLENKFGITGKNLIQKIYHEKFEIQKIAETIINISERLDYNFKDIITGAVESLTILVKTIYDKGRFNKEFEIVFIGGLIDKKNYFRNELIYSLKNKFPKIKIVKPKYSPTIGALLMAKNFFKV